MQAEIRRRIWYNPARKLKVLDRLQGRRGYDDAESVKRHMSSRRRYTRNEKIFYILSLLIVFSMVLSLIYVAITPG